ncbi:MAG: serpin family protein [Saprospiraceae bacterium]
MNRLLLLIALLSAFAACTPENHDRETLPGTVDVEALVNANNQLGFLLLSHLDTAASNVLISPYSIQSALWMTLQGAKNNTRSAMISGLQLGDLVPADVAATYPELDASLIATEHTRFRSFNTLFYDANRLTVAGDFRQVMTNAFDAPLNDLDFNQPDAVDHVNQWVKEKTEGKIDKIIDQITEDDVMILLNALTITGDWLYPFPVEATFDQDFHLPDGTTVKTPMMHLDWNLAHERTTEGAMVQLPLRDSNYAALFILPEADPVQQPELWHQSVRTLFSRFTSQKHDPARALLTLPLLEVSYKVLLNESLKSLGMELPFDPQQADLSGLGTPSRGNMFIRRVDHRTYLKMDEKGLDGAAVTSVTIGVTSLPPVYNFDRSFALIVYHLPTRTVIFDGVIHDPMPVE